MGMGGNRIDKVIPAYLYSVVYDVLYSTANRILLHCLPIDIAQILFESHDV